MEPWLAALVWVGLAGVSAVTAAAVAVRRWRLRRSLAEQCRRTPVTRVHELPVGAKQRVALEGHARALETLAAPFSGKRAIGFRVTVVFEDPGGREAPRRREVELSQILEFEVVDGSGHARVRGGPAVLAAAPRELDPGQVAVALTRPEVEQLILQQGLSAVDLVTGRNLRVTEHLLLPDSPVYVCGRSRAEVDPTGVAEGYRQPPTRAVIEPPANGPLIVADCHRDQLLAEISRRLA